MSTFVIEDSKNKFALVEWVSQGALPYNLLTSAVTIFNASTGEFIKNKMNRKHEDLPSPTELATALPVTREWKGLGTYLIGFDNKEIGFSVTLNDLVQSNPTPRSIDYSPLEMRVLKARTVSGDFQVKYDHRSQFRDFNIEGTRTGRLPSSDLPTQELSQKPKRDQ